MKTNENTIDCVRVYENIHSKTNVSTTCERLLRLPPTHRNQETKKPRNQETGKTRKQET